MTLTDTLIKNIVKKVIKGEDYRIEIVNLINAEFLQFVIDFFKKIIDAKFRNKDITDWYKKEFIKKEGLSKKEITINSGLNEKTITNMYRTSNKKIVIDSANEHFDSLYSLVDKFIDEEEDLALTLTLEFKGVSVALTINETLIVINTLAVKRAALRGGLWSTAGKTCEKVLMKTLCDLYSVDEKYYDAKHFRKDKTKDVDREVDFYLILSNGDKKRCEVKLMGQGNPESADALFAREANVFVADSLSQQNKNQADKLGAEWVELRVENGYKKFATILAKFKIPYIDISPIDFERKLDCALNNSIG
ncbi:MAG: CfrBI family restriction endonuclease [Clostridiales bacterium]|jgi:hypothetical protein|nr:CfrBI family restriction endonuclease [Clostridiales bacterium]